MCIFLYHFKIAEASWLLKLRSNQSFFARHNSSWKENLGLWTQTKHRWNTYFLPFWRSKSSICHVVAESWCLYKGISFSHMHTILVHSWDSPILSSVLIWNPVSFIHVTCSLGCPVGISDWTYPRQTLDSSSPPAPPKAFLSCVKWHHLCPKPWHDPWFIHFLHNLYTVHQPCLLACCYLQKYIHLLCCHSGRNYHYLTLELLREAPN